MAEPKKRTNRSKTGMRRMHIHATAPALNFCSNCHEPQVRHHVCSNCGFYKGKKVVDTEKVKKEKSEDNIEKNDTKK